MKIRISLGTIDFVRLSRSIEKFGGMSERSRVFQRQAGRVIKNSTSSTAFRCDNPGIQTFLSDLYQGKLQEDKFRTSV